MRRRHDVSGTTDARRAGLGRGRVPTGRARPCPWLVGLLLCACVLSGYALSFNVDQPAHNGDWYLRYQVTCSIVEHNSFAITPYANDARTGPGLRHKIYAQYTLGQSVAMVPLYLLGRRLAGLAHTDCAYPIAPPIVLLTCKLLGPILGALLAALFYATARLLAYTRRIALALAALLAFGSPLWPDVQSNLEHTLESLFLLAAAYATLRYTLGTTVDSRQSKEERRLWLVAMGLAAGLVFVTRVAGLIAIPIFAVYLVALHVRGRDLALYAAGVLPSLLVNAAYDAARFGSPLKTGPYPDQSFGYPPWLGLPNLLVSPGKGLLWYAPALLLLALAVRPFRRRLPLPALLCALVCGVYLLFYSNVNYWHGDPAWGPRYLYATLPYLILPLGEVFARWRGYRRPVRGLLVGALALSFLVQFSAVSVSYWRSFHYIFATYPDQIDRYSWGFNMNYFWKPGQSPLLLSLQGIAGDVQNYLDHAPLAQHATGEHLGSANESCLYRVYHRAAVCLTDVDDLRARASLNTFTPWWLHADAYPWWSPRAVIGIASALLALFLSSGAALLRLTAPATRVAGLASAAALTTTTDGPARRDAPHARTRGAVAAASGGPSRAAVTAATAARAATATTASAGGRAVVAEVAQLGPRVAYGLPAYGGAALRPLAAAALVGALLYGGIAVAGAVGVARPAAPLVRVVTSGRIVVDGSLAYRVLSITRQRFVPDNLYPLSRGHLYAVVRVWLRNLSLHRRRSIHRTNFMLTDPNGEATYQWPCWMPMSTRRRLSPPETLADRERMVQQGREKEDAEDLGIVVRAPARARVGQSSCPPLRARSFVDPAVSISGLYHLAPAWYPVSPRSAVQRVLVYVVPESARHFALLGPGITLTRLDLSVPRGSTPAAARVRPSRAVATPLLLAMRSDPRMGASIIEWLVQGVEVRIDGQRGAWLAVTTPTHRRGYVLRRDVRLKR